MKKRIRKIFSGLLSALAAFVSPAFVLPAFIFSGWVSPVWAETSLTLVSAAHEPYAIAREDRGISIDVIREAFAVSGQDLRVEYIPYVKLGQRLAKGGSDIYEPVMLAQKPDKMFLGQSHFQILNTVISLKSQPLLKNVSGLAGMRVIAFRGARGFLGNEFADIIRKIPVYIETDQHLEQVFSLLDGSVDFSVGGIRFAQYALLRKGRIEDEAQLKYHQIFPPVVFYPAFKDQKRRDQFNVGLAHLIDTGKYQQIIDRYTKKAPN